MSSMEALPSASEMVASTLTVHDWNRERQTIEDLRAGNTLAQIMATMSAKGFIATQHQYKRKFAKWNNTKYRKRNGKRPADSILDPEQRQKPMFRTLEGTQRPSSTAPRDESYQPPHAIQRSVDAVISSTTGYVEGLSNFTNLESLVPSGPANRQHVPGFAYGTGLQPELVSRTHALARPDSTLYNFQLDLQPADYLTFDGGFALDMANPHPVDQAQSGSAPVQSQTCPSVAKFWQPIHNAAENGHLAVVKLLVRLGCPVDVRGAHDETALHHAARNGFKEIVEFLLRNGADVNPSSSDNDYRAIHAAAENGHFDILKLLLTYGADPDSKEVDGTTPLWYVCDNGHKEIVKLLLSLSADPNARWVPMGRAAIYQAAQNGHYEVLALLIQHGANIDAIDVKGQTPLMVAAQKGHVEVVNLLLKSAADIHIEHKSGATALLFAAEEGHVDCVKILLENKAKPSHADKDGRHPLHCAAYKGHLEVVRLLVENKAEVDTPSDGESTTALSLAAQEGHTEIVEYLFQKGASLVIPIQ